jgi:hypothetical protein
MMMLEYTELRGSQRITGHFAQIKAAKGTTLSRPWLIEFCRKTLIFLGYPRRSSGAARIRAQNTLYLELGE